MKKIILILLFIPFLTFSQVYNFNSDILDEIPANVTEVNGTIRVSSDATGGQAIEAQTITTGNTAVFNMDLFTSASDYSVTWKETYTTARRDGFILRGTSSNSKVPGIMQGYLFQASSSRGHARIYRSNAGDFTLLATVNLAPSGINTPRWYRATVNGSALQLHYSTDGIIFIHLLNITDTSYTSGNTQYTIGYGDGVGGMNIDDVTYVDNEIPENITQIYNFDSDTLDEIPANVTEVNGTIRVSSHQTEGQAIEAQTITTGNTAVFNMDLFTSASDYSVTWKETYTTARRDGFILRGTSSNSMVPGIMQGYLFQASSSRGHARIYRSNAGDFTLLATVNLASSGINTPRWYRATVNGNLLRLDYSTDGSSFIHLLTTTDTAYTSGNTQYTIGYGDGIGGMYVDDVVLENISTDSVNINNINPYQVIQRDASGTADILVRGIYTGTPANIEARWNESATWTTMILDANGTGTFSGTLVAQSQGQGLLEVRFSNDTFIINSIANVGIGDIYIIAGQSNASGRGITYNNYTHASLKAAQFGNNDTWSELQDAVDSNSGQIDNISSDNAKGSPWPLIATSILASQNIPIAFVPTPKGGTRISQWQPGADHSNASTLYGSMNRRITLVGGNAKAILFFQGESDASNSTAQATYETGLNTFINTAASDFTGLKTMVGQIGRSGFSGNNLVRAAQINVLHNNSNAILGPVTYDIDLSDGDNLHFKSDADMTEFARRWYKAIEKEFYSGTNGYGPIVDEANLDYNSILNKITVPFTDDTVPVINSGSTVATSSFDLKNNGVSVSISSLAIVDNTIELTPSTALNIGQTITLSYALNNDGVNAAIYDNENLPAENFYNLVISNITPVVSNWTGTTNTDWATTSNWSSNSVPTATDNLVIPNVTNSPIISNSTAAVVNNIRINASATLTIDGGGSLTMNGNLTQNGTFNINADATTNGSLIINGTATGDVTYNRYVTIDGSSASKGWHLVSSPVNSQNIADFYSMVYQYGTRRAIAPYVNTNEVNAKWDYYTTADSPGNFTKGKGYIIKTNINDPLPFKGTLNTNDAGVNISVNATGDNYNAIGNPYTSYINGTTLLDNILVERLSEKTIWLWDANANNNEGEYTTKNSASEYKIAPGQGFFVKTLAPGTINFSETAQTHIGLDTFLKQENRPEIKLFITDGTNIKSAEIFYIENKTTGFDDGYDSSMFSGAATSNTFAVYTQLVSDNEGKKLAIQTLPNSDYENMIISIGVNATIGTEITFTANDLNLPTDIQVFLEDRQANTFTRLDEANSNYKITTTIALNGIGRFYIHTSRSSLTIKDIALENIGIYKTNASALRITGLQNNSKTNVTLFNLIGKQVLNTSFKSNGLKDIALPKLATGVYIVKLKTNTGLFSKKIILD
jgi:hypothetical protein